MKITDPSDISILSSAAHLLIEAADIAKAAHDIDSSTKLFAAAGDIASAISKALPSPKVSAVAPIVGAV